MQSEHILSSDDPGSPWPARLVPAFVRRRRPIVVALHLGLVVASSYGAFWLRFDGVIPQPEWELFTATLPVDVPESGKLKLKGKGVKKRTKAAYGPGEVKLAVRAAGNAQRHLRAVGKTKVRVRVTYTPTTGQAQTASQKIKLVEG